MFTGIILAKGTILGIEKSRATSTSSMGLELWVDIAGLELTAIHIGDSIAINGTCLTVTQLDQTAARFDVSGETLSKCLIGHWQVNQQVNLETALTLQTPLGGHLVSGHVDGIGHLDKRVDSADSTWMQFSASRDIGKFIAIKGSITVDGISLTTNHVFDEGEETCFEVTLVPHTLNKTNLGTLNVDDNVHLEIDLLARYLQRMMESEAQSVALNSEISGNQVSKD